MMVIYKYPILVIDSQCIELPKGAVILSVGVQNEIQVCLWAVVDPTQGVEYREIVIIGTGNPMTELPANLRRAFIGTVLQGPFVWHVFEVVHR